MEPGSGVSKRFSSFERKRKIGVKGGRNDIKKTGEKAKRNEKERKKRNRS
jgi:hypothetical protein